MGSYTTRPLDAKELKSLIDLIALGYTDPDGTPHKPNRQIAVILTLQANLGCRIGDICALAVESFVNDGEVWKLNITEQKTGKARYFIVPGPVKRFVDQWIAERGIYHGALFSINEYAVWKQMRAATKTLGMENVSTHSLRKYSCRKVYEASGKDIALTSAFMNHKSPSTTYLYLRMSSKQMDEAISKTVTLI